MFSTAAENPPGEPEEDFYSWYNSKVKLTNSILHGCSTDVAVSESVAGEHQVSLKVLSVHPEVVTRALRAVKGTRKVSAFPWRSQVRPFEQILLNVDHRICWDAAWQCEPWKKYCLWWQSCVLHTNRSAQTLCLMLICITEEAATLRVERKSKSDLFNKLVSHQRAAHLLFTVRLWASIWRHNCVSLHNYNIASPHCRQRREGIHLLLPESCLQLFAKP